MTAKPTTPEPEAKDAAPVDLMRGWEWRDLLAAALSYDLPAGATADTIVAGIIEELEHRGGQIDETLANRSDEASLEERVLALERKILMLRYTNEIAIGLTTHWVKQILEAVRDGVIATRSTSPGYSRPPVASPRVDKAAEQLAQRRRMLGQ